MADVHKTVYPVYSIYRPFMSGIFQVRLPILRTFSEARIKRRCPALAKHHDMFSQKNGASSFSVTSRLIALSVDAGRLAPLGLLHES
jgi:hypothetical protein